MTDEIRSDLAELRERLAGLEDAARPEAVAKRRKTGQRTARENVAALVDEGSFSEYGGLALAAQHQKLTHADMLPKGGYVPATHDILIDGLNTVAPSDYKGCHRELCRQKHYPSDHHRRPAVRPV